MILIAGLGNPGAKYDATRHNVGFHVVDELAARFHTRIQQKKHRSLYTEIQINHEKVLLVKPQTYMNRSGESVLKWMQFYRLEPSQLLVVYDDLDFDPGQVRLRKKGSAGTHNGMKSIISHLGTDAFPRIRVGIGRPLWQSAAAYVLSRLSPEEIPPMREAVHLAADAAVAVVTDGIDQAMNRYNQKSAQGPETGKELP